MKKKVQKKAYPQFQKAKNQVDKQIFNYKQWPKSPSNQPINERKSIGKQLPVKGKEQYRLKLIDGKMKVLSQKQKERQPPTKKKVQKKEMKPAAKVCQADQMAEQPTQSGYNMKQQSQQQRERQPPSKKKVYKKEIKPAAKANKQVLAEEEAESQPTQMAYNLKFQKTEKMQTIVPPQVDMEKLKHPFQQAVSKLKAQLQLQKVNIIKRNSVEMTKQILGKGGFGVVYKGTYNHTPVAIKYFAIFPQQFKILQEQIVLTTNLRHPRIVQLYGVCLEQEYGHFTCLLVMQLMQTDLQIYLSKNKLTLLQKSKILKQLVEGVSFIHNQRIVHRDLKPKNILLDQKANIKIADLGISRLLENKQKTSGMTVAFTPMYVSKETAIDQITSFASDIWALGIIIYEVLTGFKPWANRKANSIIVGLSRQQDPFSSFSLQKLKEQKQVGVWSDLIKACTDYKWERRPKIEQVWQRMDILNK